MSGTSAARERILLTAHDLFYRHGLRATGIDRIIAEADVAKLTFYRHFPSKHDLVLAFLEHRHATWMAWFTGALARHGGGPGSGLQPVHAALKEWIDDPAFRGCAFINSVAEAGEDMPGVHEIARRHKDEMTAALQALLPARPDPQALAAAAALAVDGAIVRAQGADPAPALQALALLLQRLDPVPWRPRPGRPRASAVK